MDPQTMGLTSEYHTVDNFARSLIFSRLPQFGLFFAFVERKSFFNLGYSLAYSKAVNVPYFHFADFFLISSSYNSSDRYFLYRPQCGQNAHFLAKDC